MTRAAAIGPLARVGIIALIAVGFLCYQLGFVAGRLARGALWLYAAFIAGMRAGLR